MWTLPRGWKAGPLVFPEPERTLMFQIKAQGFDRDVMLRTELTPPANLKPGASVTLSAKAAWMCCGNTCHPGAADLTLTLPVAEKAEVNTKWQRLLDAERARAEQRSAAWKATASEKGMSLTLRLQPVSAEARIPVNPREAAEIIVFTEDGWFDSDKPQLITRGEDGSLTIQLSRAETYMGGKAPATLRCILRCEKGWVQGQKWRCLQVEPKIVR
jgi:DsbC/DsbD-like thiol-disulfide interchange protein